MNESNAAELANEILTMLQKARADLASILASSDERIAILKESNAMLAAHRAALTGRGLGNG
jgi:hypothetical protein